MYFYDGHCTNRIFGAGTWCRWHKIVEEFRADLSKRPRLAAHAMMFGSSIDTMLAIWCISLFISRGNLACLMLAVFALGSGVKFLADGFIAQDHPFGQLALWGKLLTIGVITEVIVGNIAGYYIVSTPSETLALIRLASESPLWLKLGPSLVPAFLFLMAGSSARLLMRRLLFVRRPALNHFVLAFMLISIGTASRYAIMGPERADVAAISGQTSTNGLHAASSEHPSPPSDSVKSSESSIRDKIEAFWEPVSPTHPSWGIGIAWVSGFILSEFINIRLRRRGSSRVVFRATIWPSYPICYGSPMLAAVVSRFLVLWIDVHTLWAFIPFTLLLTGVISTFGTNMVIRQYLDSLDSQQDAGTRSSNQDLLLFLKCQPIERNSSLPHEMMRLLGEVDLTLNYTSAGSIDECRQEGDYFVIHMIGESSDMMFRILQDLINSSSIRAGSFAMLRRGPQSREEIIEL